jgi:8-oxo-dGTP pyrophosphatase MutT (NUDIX family)
MADNAASAKSEARRTELWEIFVIYIGIILTLLSLLLFAAAALANKNYHTLAGFMRDVAEATFPVGVISLIFERILRKYYVSTLREAVNEEMVSNLPRLTREAVIGAIDATDAIRTASLSIAHDMERFALAKIMTRQEMEVCDINFRSGVEACAASGHDKMFLLVGKTLTFTSKQTEAMRYGLENGVAFQLGLIDPLIISRDSEAQRHLRSRIEDSITRFRAFLLSDRGKWSGSIEIRRMPREIENAFSSFIKNGERISVLDLDLGDDASLQCSQVYIHDAARSNSFGARLYGSYVNLWNQSDFLMSFPARHKYVYIYGRRDSNLVWVRKEGLSTWELPGGKINVGEVADEAAVREFHEETGLTLSIETVFQTAESDKLAFIGAAGEGELLTSDPAIAEVKMYPLHRQWDSHELSYPLTDYSQYVRMIGYLGL